MNKECRCDDECLFAPGCVCQEPPSPQFCTRFCDCKQLRCQNRPQDVKCTCVHGNCTLPICPCFQQGSCGALCTCTECLNQLVWQSKRRRSERSNKRLKGWGEMLQTSSQDGVLLSKVWGRLRQLVTKPIDTDEPGPSSQAGLEFGRSKRLKTGVTELSITRPDDWHLHLCKDPQLLKVAVRHSSQHFGRAMIMPNVTPLITTRFAALAYKTLIMKACPVGGDFKPLMTLYLTDTMSANDIKSAKSSGIIYGIKVYATATTPDLFGKCVPALEEMVRQDIRLLVHGEVSNDKVDIFDREKELVATILTPLTQRFPKLKVVVEHITTIEAINFVEASKEGYVAATVTPQHLTLNRNSFIEGGMPQSTYLPLLKRESHRQKLVSSVTSGSRRFFAGTDSCPHEGSRCGCGSVFNSPVAISLYAKVFEEAGALNNLEAFLSLNGPKFYGLRRNTSKIKLSKISWVVPPSYDGIIPMFAGKKLDWSASKL